ncbi:MAG: DUF3300 domain-containing protein, partial [Chthoniobacterales bacterium]
MKTKNTLTFRAAAMLCSVLLAALVVPVVHQSATAQTNQPAQYEPVLAPEDEYILLSDEELDELLGPIALYPDALVALILPASTVPTDVTLATRFMDNGDIDLVDEQPWDESVISLTRYPDVLAWMDENLEWTAAVGEAFYEQPSDVMNAMQRLRRDAQAAGNLVNTPQQTVVFEKGDDAAVVEENIRIVPTDPEVIYVPTYDPQVVY